MDTTFCMVIHSIELMLSLSIDFFHSLEIQEIISIFFHPPRSPLNYYLAVRQYGGNSHCDDITYMKKAL